MISVRENTFETNSSSCHCLTIIKKSLAEKLKNREVFYIGDYHCYSDSDEVCVNDLSNVEDKDLITVEQIREELKKWVNTKAEDDTEYEKELKESFSKVDLDTCNVVDTIEEIYGDCIEEFMDCHLNKEAEWLDRIIGDSDTYTPWSKEIPLEDGDTEIIKLMEVSC